MNLLHNYKPQQVDSYCFPNNLYGLKLGIKEFVNTGKEAVMKELKQLLSRDAMEEINYDRIARDDLYKALLILMFLTMKRDNVTLK